MNEVISIIKYQFKNPFKFSGRASRKEYWVFYGSLTIFRIVINILSFLLLRFVSNVDDTVLFFAISSYFFQILNFILGIVAIWFMLTLGVRRYHDTSRSGKLMIFIIIISVVSAIICGFSFIISILGEGTETYQFAMLISGIIFLISIIYNFKNLVTRGDIGPNKYGADPYGDQNEVLEVTENKDNE